MKPGDVWWWWWLPLLVVNLLSLLLHPLQDSDFDSTGGLLGATIGRVKQLSRGSQTKLLCYMLLFCCFVFFILYWFIKLRWSVDRVGWPVAFINPVARRSWMLKRLDWHTWRRGRRKSQIYFIFNFFLFFKSSIRLIFFFLSSKAPNWAGRMGNQWCRTKRKRKNGAHFQQTLQLSTLSPKPSTHRTVILWINLDRDCFNFCC